MNNVIFMGRLTRDPETRYSQNNMAVTKFSLAVDRLYKREGQPTADFFNITSFGKQAEFASKYLTKGTKVVVMCSAQNDNYKDKDGKMVYNISFVANQIEFAESKRVAESNASANTGASAPAQTTAQPPKNDDFMSIPDGIEDELPFN